MPSLRDLKRRIKSVEGIRQITRAMEMVSATKLRRAQQRIEAARPYSEKIDEMLFHLGDAVRADLESVENLKDARQRAEGARPYAIKLDEMLSQMAELVRTGSAHALDPATGLESAEAVRTRTQELLQILPHLSESVWGGILPSADAWHAEQRIEQTREILGDIVRLMSRPAEAAPFEEARDNLAKAADALTQLRRIIRSGLAQHPLLAPREKVRRLLIVAVASDKGLCGSFNSNVIRHTERRAREAMDQKIEVELLLVGRKIHDYFRRRGWPVRMESECYRNIDQSLPVDFLQHMTDLVASLFLTARFDQVDMVYTHFKSAISQRVLIRQFLPIGETGPSREGGVPVQHEPREYIFEIRPETLFRQLVTKLARGLIFSMLADSLASEQGARMTSMRNATDNALEMIDTLTLQRNKARQAAITKELSEIVGGAEALTG